MKFPAVNLQIRSALGGRTTKRHKIAQITVPVSVVRQMGWEKGTQLRWFVTKRGVLLRSAKTLKDRKQR